MSLVPTCPQSMSFPPLAMPFPSAHCTKLFPLLRSLFTCLNCILLCNCIYCVRIRLSPFCLTLSILMQPHAICCLRSHSQLSCHICFPSFITLIFISPSLHPNLCTHLSSTTPNFSTPSLIFNLKKTPIFFSRFFWSCFRFVCVRACSSVRIDMDG